MENENNANETQELILYNLRTLNQNTVANNEKLSNIEKLLTEQTYIIWFFFQTISNNLSKFRISIFMDNLHQ